MKLKRGTLLVAEPFLKDENFQRSVVLLAQHSEEDGSVGFIINRPYKKTLNQLIDGIGNKHMPVYLGGPVQQDTLHFIHKCPEIIEGGKPIKENIYLGGNFEQVISLIVDGILTPRDIRFYLGYSGWDAFQLQEEIEQHKSWYLHHIKQEFLFSHNVDVVWKQVLNDMGSPYNALSNYPIDPTLN